MPYNGRFIKNPHLNRWETPSCDIASYLEMREADFLNSLLLERDGKPEARFLYRDASTEMCLGTGLRRRMVTRKMIRFLMTRMPARHRDALNEIYKAFGAKRFSVIVEGNKPPVEAGNEAMTPEPEVNAPEKPRVTAEESEKEPRQQVKTFSFEGKDIRTVQIDGVAYWAGKDVCDRLGYAHASKAYAQHCKGVALHHPFLTAGGMQQMRVLTESDVHRLIVGSELPEAERFRTWLFEEVLPSIRKTGSYTAPGAAAVSGELTPAIIATIVAAVTSAMEPLLQRLLSTRGADKSPAVAAERSPTSSFGRKPAGRTSPQDFCRGRMKWVRGGLNARLDFFRHALSAHKWITLNKSTGRWEATPAGIDTGWLDNDHFTMTLNGNELYKPYFVITAAGVEKFGELFDTQPSLGL